MLIVVVLALLLIGNWFFTESLIFVPVDILNRLSSLSWWVLALISISLIAWCIGDD